MIAHTPTQGSRRRLALVLVVPSVLTMFAVLGVEVWRLVSPAGAETGHRIYGTLGEAIVADDLRGVMDFLQRGQSPDALIPVHDPALTGGREILVPPILWAAAAGRQRMVLALLGAGVTFERAADKAAACLADQLAFPEIATSLRQIARLPAPSACPPAPSGPPLLPLGLPTHTQPDR